jgi:hypothetical protein
MRRVVRTIIAISALMTLLLSAVPVAGQTETICSGYDGYFYQGLDFSGLPIHKCYGTNYTNLGDINWNDRIASLELDHSSGGQGIIFYWDINFGGASWKMCRNTSRSDLGSWNYNISSWKWVNNCPI